MDAIKRKKSFNILIFFVMAALAVLFLFPILLTYMNAFKPLGDILKNTLKLPSSLYLNNFEYSIGIMDFSKLLLNTVIIVSGSVILIVFVSSMAGYALCRSKYKANNILLTLLLISMIIPFQTIMIPLVKVADFFGVINSIYGLIVINVALFSPFAVFLYQGAIKMIPLELDEAAKIDGCTPFSVYFRIILPLLKPTTASVVILESLWLWNDFALPVVMLQESSKKTLTVGVYSFFSSNSMRWDYALAGLVLSSLPIVVFYIAMQKNIIKGVTEGSVKG